MWEVDVIGEIRTKASNEYENGSAKKETSSQNK